MGLAVSAAGQVAAAVACFQRLGRLAAEGRRMGGKSSRAAAKPQLVYEVPERAPVTAGQPARADPRSVL